MDATRVDPLSGGTRESGRLAELVSGAETVIKDRLATFRQHWLKRDAFHAAVAFERFREALVRHVRWEEESLFEEVERRCRVEELPTVRRHHLEHEKLEAMAERLSGMLASAIDSRPPPAQEIELDRVAGELSHLLEAHRECELREVCCKLDAVLTSAEIDEIAQELDERGRPRS